MRNDIYDFSYGNETYFYDPESGGVYQHNPLLRDILALAPSLDSAQITRELSDEYPAEKITSLLTYLQKHKILPLGKIEPAAPGKVSDKGLEEMYLQVSHQCNLNCTYCYARGGNFGGPDRVMTETTARQAVDFFLRESGSRQTLILNFDGGEPFLNFPVVQSTVAYAQEKGRQLGKKIRPNISTNGALFTAQNVAYLAQDHFGIGLSIDGDRAAHDHARKFRNGRGSYRTLVQRLHDTQLLKHHPTVNARATITKETRHCSRTLFHLYRMGFRCIYLEPAAGKNETWAIDGGDMEIIKEEFDKIAEFYKEELLKGNHFILRNFFQVLERLHRRNRSGHRCGAGRQTAAVSPDGSLYPCYKFVGIKNYIMGNVGAGEYDKNLSARFRENHAGGKPGCQNCWARYLCGGGCPYLSEVSHGNIAIKDDLDCQFTRHIAKLSLEIYVHISRENRKTWNNLFA
ncbi:MAG: radical SAM protein [Candidatus Aminicenantes bacterium]|nr:radical SAM protein [Candidatus Aminicenantes bacterium]